jgi:hypothetical protein
MRNLTRPTGALRVVCKRLSRCDYPKSTLQQQRPAECIRNLFSKVLYFLQWGVSMWRVGPENRCDAVE